MRLTFLGTGNAGNVPNYGCDCPACERAITDPTHRRLSACALVENGNGAHLMIDAGLPNIADLFPPGSLHTILLTHFHMDHVHGLFPIRWGSNIGIEVIGPDDPVGSDDLFKHPGVLDFSQKAQAFETFDNQGFTITPVPLNHSRPTLGYVFEHQDKTLAYLTDTVGLPAETENWLLQRTIDTLVLDCSFPPSDKMPKGHNDLNSALATIAKIKPAKAYLTHISHELDTWFMSNSEALPDNVLVASDKLSINF